MLCHLIQTVGTGLNNLPSVCNTEDTAVSDENVPLS